jgi:putative transposase
MIAAVESLGQEIGISRACRVLGVSRSSVYRARQARSEPPARPTPPRALSVAEREEVLAVLNSARFAESAPRQVYARLLDEDGVYLCHWRTMYRVQAAEERDSERRAGRRTRQSKPELAATGPRQLWSWDITQLKGRGEVYYLYVILDVFSRYIVGWLLAAHERGGLAKQLVAETCRKQGIARQQLTLHADHGSPMRAKPLKDLLRALEIRESHARPYTPTDNAYSEAGFGTLKSRPAYPERFRDIQEARRWVRDFVQWYNEEHYHTGLALLTPASVHYDGVTEILAQRQDVLDAAYATHPERFVGGPPQPQAPPRKVWINQPWPDPACPPAFSGAGTEPPQPGAQAESKAENVASLDPAEHLATIGGSRTRKDTERAKSLHLLEAELCQSH